jgi:hypothetical protein
VAVGADERVGVGDRLARLVGVGPDGLGEVFEVHLVADAGARGHDAEVVERVLAPLEEDVALHVALVFAVHVHLEGARVAEFVDHHRMVDDEVHGVQRVDLVGVAAERHDPVAHRGEVDDRRHAGEVLHQHAGGAVGDLARVLAALRGPVGEGADVVHADGLAVLEAQHVLEHDLERRGQAREGAETGLLGGGDRVVGVAPAACGERAAGLRRVLSDGDGHGCDSSWPEPIVTRGPSGSPGPFDQEGCGNFVYHGAQKLSAMPGPRCTASR